MINTATPIQIVLIMNNKTALVTGGTKGIGKSIVIELLKRDYEVVINYGHSDEDAAKLSKELEKNELNKFHFVKFDNSNVLEIEDFIDDLGSKLKSNLDLVVFNAGLTYKGKLGDLDIDAWKKVFDVNVHFPVFFLNSMKSRLRDKGNIIFISSLMAVHPHSTSLAYGISKKAVLGLAENLVKDFAAKKVRVNAIVPGFVESEWHKSKSQELIDRIKSKIALNDFCAPQDIAKVCLNIIDNNYINGSIIKVDGGYSFQ